MRRVRPAFRDLRSRHIEREWLDDLPAHDPRAMRSRRDLQRINAWMLQARIMRGLLSTHWSGPPPRSMLELGGGDGTFLLQLAEGLALQWPQLAITLVDKEDVVSDRTRDALGTLGWHLEVLNADVFDALGGLGRADVTFSNLFLHHLDESSLRRLLDGVSELTTLFVACDPRRSALALWGSRLLWAIGCNEVSRHDGVASVRAGFRGRELSRLWPDSGSWVKEEGEAGLFSHAFVACRGEA